MIFLAAVGMPEAIRKKFYPFIRPQVRRELAVESSFILLVYAGLLILALFVHPGFWGLFTGQVVGHCLLISYLTLEHNRLPHEGDIMDRTRSINTNRLVKLLMWNMPYHAEHHAYPAIPFYALPQLHIEIKEELKHKDEGYRAFHLGVLQGRIRGK